MQRLPPFRTDNESPCIRSATIPRRSWRTRRASYAARLGACCVGGVGRRYRLRVDAGARRRASTSTWCGPARRVRGRSCTSATEASAGSVGRTHLDWAVRYDACRTANGRLCGGCWGFPVTWGRFGTLTTSCRSPRAVGPAGSTTCGRCASGAIGRRRESYGDDLRRHDGCDERAVRTHGGQPERRGSVEARERRREAHGSNHVPGLPTSGGARVSRHLV